MSEQSNKDMSKHFYRASAADFMKIPGSPVAYWLGPRYFELFEVADALKDIATVKHGLSTGKNEEVVRRWFEVNVKDFGPGYSSREDALESGQKWFPYNKGGDYRKWFGNCEFVLRYDEFGNKLMANFSGHRHDGKSHYFLEGVTWTFISSSNFAARYTPSGFVFDVSGSSLFVREPKIITAFLCSNLCYTILKALNPTLNFQVGNLKSLPILEKGIASYRNELAQVAERCIEISKTDWDGYETSWDFTSPPILEDVYRNGLLSKSYLSSRRSWRDMARELKILEEKNNNIFIKAYGLQQELNSEVTLGDITLICNPYYRYSDNRNEDELENTLQSDSIAELLSFAIGCMMGRYSPDKPGLILASQGETIHDYLEQIPSPKFMPDDDAILPLTDQEWFTDDVTNRFREFVKMVWGEDTLQENLEFVAESLCLHAIKPKKSETAMETIRRYLSTQFFADHMKTYKKRPIYWLFSSGKQKAFECLVYLHRYNEGTLSRMRTEYVTPLMGKYESQIRHIEEQQETASTAEKNKLSKALKGYQSKLNELREFDNKLKHYADRRISLDLDDGVKVNYGKFGDLLAKVKEITGKAPITD